MTKLQLHLNRWADCTRCPLCRDRRSVVLFRGTVPCDVLFVGEAPGESEDCLGEPFVGPAGHLLDEIISSAWGGPGDMWHGIKHAFTNIVCCIPREEDGSKISEPPDEAILACQERLAEFVGIAKPRLVVLVGSLAQEWVGRTGPRSKALALPPDTKTVELIHPAAILRAPTIQKTLLIRRAEVTLANALKAL